MVNEVSLQEKDLTDRQQIFVTQVAMGISHVKAAEIAGYTDPGASGWRTLALPHIQEAIRAEREMMLAEIAGLSVIALRELVGPNNPPAVRLRAAERSLDMAGHVAKPAIKALADKTMGEMTAAELREVMRQSRAEMEKARQGHGAMVSAEIIDVTAEKPSND